MPSTRNAHAAPRPVTETPNTSACDKIAAELRSYAPAPVAPRLAVRRIAASSSAFPKTVTLAVPSDSTPGVVYTVAANLALGLVSCDCPDFRYRKVCKHVSRVLPTLALVAAVEA